METYNVVFTTSKNGCYAICVTSEDRESAIKKAKRRFKNINPKDYGEVLKVEVCILED